MLLKLASEASSVDCVLMWLEDIEGPIEDYQTFLDRAGEQP